MLPPPPRKVLEPWFRAEVLALLRREGLVSEALAEKMLTWRHTGFSAHNAVRVGARDAEARRRLAGWRSFALTSRIASSNSAVIRKILHHLGFVGIATNAENANRATRP